MMIGVVSALAAIGGGAMTVPFLVWCGVPVRRAIGTSAAVGFPIALGGVLVTSIIAASFGARAAHGLPVPVLKRIFAGLLVLLAVKMLLQLFGSLHS